MKLSILMWIFGWLVQFTGFFESEEKNFYQEIGLGKNARALLEQILQMLEHARSKLYKCSSIARANFTNARAK